MKNPYTYLPFSAISALTGNTITERFCFPGILVTRFVQLLIIILVGLQASPQTGYIYVHTKTLDESSSTDFTFNISGGPTFVPSFNLNDNPANIAITDLGVSQNGRIWGVSAGGALYYRSAGSSAWLLSGFASGTPSRVDGAGGNNVYVLTSAGGVYLYDLTTATLLGGASDGAVDVGSSWNANPYRVSSTSGLQRWNGASWANIGSYTDIGVVDGDPSTGDAIVGRTVSDQVWRITAGNTATSLGRPTGPAATVSARDIAVDDAGNIWASWADASASGNFFAFKWQGGTTWSSRETTSREYVYRITGGAGGGVWGIYNNTGWTTLGRNILTRALDGSNIAWLNDERVHTTPANGNSFLVAVTAGTYTIAETVPAGWDLQNIYLYDPSSNSSINIAGDNATLTVAAGETVNVIFENGVVNPFSMINNCASSYSEDFGTGAAGTYGGLLTGQTPYHYSNTSANSVANFYKVVGNANMLFTGAANLTDHTSGNGQGRMMVVDANNESDAFFRRRFTGVLSGANYRFSAWIANINSGGSMKPNVTFEVIDPANYSVLNSVNTGDITTNAIWTEYNLNFTAATTTFDLIIRNNGNGGQGNDLAIDDIKFELLQVSTPVSIATGASCATGGSLSVTSPVGAAYEYSIDGTAWQTSTAFTSLLPGNYTVYARYAGSANCQNTNTDIINPSICGNLFIDANGLNNSNVDGAPYTAVNLNSVLVNASTGLVAASTAVFGTGSFGFNDMPNGNYNIIITTNTATIGSAPPSIALPPNWVLTGEDCCDNTGSDGTVNAIIGLGSINSNIINANFGLERLSQADSKLQSISSPTGNIIPAGTATQNVSGSDPEDGSMGNSNMIVITELPSNGTTMEYNAAPATLNQQITNFNPALLSFNNVPNGSASVAFKYAFIDAAGFQGSAANYTLNWLVLPVTLQSFTAKASDCDDIIISWKVADAANFSHFELERSKNSGAFEKIATIVFIENSSIYSHSDNSMYSGSYQYRLKMTDLDGHYKLSAVAIVKIDCNSRQIIVYPTHVNERISIFGLTGREQLQLYNTAGHIVHSQKATGYQENINMRNYPSGTYYLVATDKNGVRVLKTKILKTK